MLQLSAKCWNSAFNAQGSTLVRVVVQVRGVKIYVAPVEALREKERQDETQCGFLALESRTLLTNFDLHALPLAATFIMCVTE